MNEKLSLTFSMITLCVLVALTAVIAFKIYESDRDPVRVNIEDIRYKQDFGELQAFLVLADRFADQHEWSSEYNCVNYSQDLYMLAYALGYNVTRVQGWHSGNLSDSGHMWLRLSVDFEPINANFVDYSREYDVQVQLEPGEPFRIKEGKG